MGQASGSTSGSPYPRKYCDFFHMKGHTRIDCYKLMRYKYSKQKGHLKETCYKLIGYPKNSQKKEES